MKNALTKPIHPSYRADIDGLRALAVLSVVGFHAFPDRLTGGFVGVDVFFVISGYLISTIIFNNLNQKLFDFIDFYSRRIKRIFPSLITVLLFCLIFGWFVMLAAEYQLLGKHTAAGAGFVSNLVLWKEIGYFDADAETKPLLHLWSLGIEEQFYLIWPFALFVFCKIRQRLLIVILIALISSFLISIYYINANSIAAFYAPQARFWELLSGSVLAYFMLNKQDLIQNRSILSKNLISITGLFFVVIGLILVTKKVAFPGWWAILPVLGAVLLICAGQKSWVNKNLLSNKYLVWIGLISYPLYLWHWPILSFIHILENETQGKTVRIIAVLASIILAWMTYQFIERPIRFRNQSKLTVIILCALMGCIGAVGYYIYKNNGLVYRDVVIQSFDQKQIVKIESNEVAQCPKNEHYEVIAQFCRSYLAKVSGKKIILWGDSSVDAWSPVFQDIAKQNNDSLIVISHFSCPPILDARKTRFDFEGSRKYCADGSLQRKIIDYIQSLNPDLIFVIASWNSYSSYSNREFIKGDKNGEATAETTNQMITINLPETLDKLSKIGKTIVFTSWPIMPASPKVRTIDFIPHYKNEVQIDKKEFKKESEPINAIFKKINNNQIKYFDPANKICEQDYCLSELDGIKMYTDRYHISPQGTMQYKSEIRAIIKFNEKE